MLRASSEMAVAIIVRLLSEKPRRWARARPRWRAATMSRSERIGTRDSSFTGTCLSTATHSSEEKDSRRRSLAKSCRLTVAAALGFLPIQVGQTLLQVERRRDPFEGQAQLHHREGNFGLNADDDRLGAAQP